MRDTAEHIFSNFLKALVNPRTVAIWAVLTAFLAVSGPFGSYEKMGLEARFFYWGAIVTLSVIVGSALRQVCLAVLPVRPLAVYSLLYASVFALVLGPMVFGLLRWVQNVYGPDSGMRLSAVMLYVFFIALTVQVLRRWLQHGEPPPRPEQSPEAGSEADPAPIQPRLIERLPEDRRADILRLCAADHHVEVVTEAGVEQLRMRLADAVREMEPVEGLHTHRSHWVARHAVDGWEKDGAAKLYLVLSNGERVPVSRSYRARVEEAGFLT